VFEILAKYVVPLALCLFSFVVVPFLLHRVEEYQRHERKSQKYEHFITKNIVYMVFNIILLPLATFFVFSHFLDRDSPVSFMQLTYTHKANSGPSSTNSQK